MARGRPDPAAHGLDLLTTPYVFDAEQAREMTKAGADIIVCHMGLTTGGSIGAATALTLDDCVARINDWSAAARQIREDVIVLCHGGPIAQPADAAYDARSLPRLPRFLRGFQHGASAHGNGDRRADAGIQAHRAPASGRAGRCAVTGSKDRGGTARSRGMRI